MQKPESERDIWLTIKRVNNDGTYTPIKVKWNKMPCYKCKWYFHFACPHSEWNKRGKYLVY